MMSDKVNILLKGYKYSKKYSKFEDTRNFLDSLPYINAGGCGISAYAMYLWLKKEDKLPKNFKLVFLHHTSSEEEFLNNRKVLVEGKGEIYAPEHVAVKYKGDILDSSGVVSTSRYGLFFEIPLDRAEDYIVNSLNTDDWNSAFNRAMCTAIIEKELGITFRSDLRRENKSWEHFN